MKVLNMELFLGLTKNFFKLLFSIIMPIYCSPLHIQGLANRRTGATSINVESSRSHCVFTCIIESRSKVAPLFFF